MKKATLDLRSKEAWTNAEEVDAERDRLLARAEALDGEIRALVHDRRLNRYQLCLRLGCMRREQLWKPLGKRSFVRYALEVHAASSSREARQWADVADRLPDLPAIHAVFTNAKAAPSAVRAAAPVATPADDAEWARKLPHMTVAQVQAEVDRKLGRPPTSQLSVKLPAHVMAQLLELNAAQAQLLGEPVPLAETLAHLVGLGLAERAQGPAREQAPGAKPLPARKARVHTRRCDDCSTHRLRGPEGWVAVPPVEAAMLECDAEYVDERGDVTRYLSARTRRVVYERDGMACVVPGCGATLGLDFHHEGPGGWRDVGDDPERVCLLCGSHHGLRHEGWLTIKGRASTGFRFYKHGGGEIVAPRVVSAATPAAAVFPAPTSAAVPEVKEDGAHVGDRAEHRVDEVAEAALRRLQLPKAAARAAIQQVRAQVAGPLTVEELVTLVLRGMPAGRAGSAGCAPLSARSERRLPDHAERLRGRQELRLERRPAMARAVGRAHPAAG